MEKHDFPILFLAASAAAAAEAAVAAAFDACLGSFAGVISEGSKWFLMSEHQNVVLLVF